MALSVLLPARAHPHSVCRETSLGLQGSRAAASLGLAPAAISQSSLAPAAVHAVRILGKCCPAWESSCPSTVLLPVLLSIGDALNPLLP